MTKELKIKGMSCMHCVAAVTKALTAVPGVTGAEVDLKKKRAIVSFEGQVEDQALVDAVAEAGYEAKTK